MREEGKIISGQRLYGRAREKGRPASQVYQKHQQPDNRWLLKLSLSILMMSAFIWGWQKISNPATLPIKTVQVTGNYTHVDQTALRQTITPFIDKGFLWIDVNGFQDRLQQVPWVRNVAIKRVWPGRLVVKLTEEQAVARIGEDVLVDSGGDTFTVDKNTIPAGLPQFISPVAGQQKLMLQTYQAMSAVLTPLNIQITALSLNVRQSWALQLSNGIVLLVGKVNAVQRLQRFVQAYTQVVGDNIQAINSIDLRYANGIAVRFKNQATKEIK